MTNALFQDARDDRKLRDKVSSPGHGGRVGRLRRSGGRPRNPPG